MEIIPKYFVKINRSIKKYFKCEHRDCVCVFKQNLFWTTANYNGETLVLKHKSQSS